MQQQTTTFGCEGSATNGPSDEPSTQHVTAISSRKLPPHQHQHNHVFWISAFELSILSSLLDALQAHFTNMPSLLDLPAELQNAIYHEVLVCSNPIRLEPRHSFGHDQFTESLKESTYTYLCESKHRALTQTSRQLRAETLPIFYGANRFCFHIDYVDCKWDKEPDIVQDREGVRWVTTLPETAIAHMRQLLYLLPAVQKELIADDHGSTMMESENLLKHFLFCERRYWVLDLEKGELRYMDGRHVEVEIETMSACGALGAPAELRGQTHHQGGLSCTHQG